MKEKSVKGATIIASGAEPVPAKPVEMNGIEEATHQLLKALGQGEKPDVLAQTPRRVAKFYNEFMNPSNIDIESDFKLFDNPGLTDMVIVNDIHYVLLCEHHLAPAFGVAHIAYIPDQHIVGFSKLQKALNYFARQPQLDERLVVDSISFIENRLKPKGIALVMRTIHSCMALRANAPMQEIHTISEFRGMMKDEPYRSSFWATAMAQKPVFLG